MTARTSIAANLLLAGGSIAVTLVLLSALEGGLRLAGLGAPDPAGTSRLRYQQVQSPIFEAARLPDGSEVLATADARLPYQIIRTEKPERSLRIFVFGGSAAAGLGYSPNVTFARHLERLLERAHPDRVVEVVNLGIVAFASSQVRALVEEVCRAYEPDAIIVYSGNNEFLEIHARRFAESEATLPSRTAERLRETHLYRLASRALSRPPKGPSAVESGLAHEDLRVTEHDIVKQIQLTSDEIDEVVGRYEENIDRITRIAEASGTPILLMTVASNWRYRGRDDLPDDWLDEVLGEPGPHDEDRLRAALPVLDRRIESGDPMQRWEALYRRAAAEEELGDLAAARAGYRRAMNEDPHLRRALDAMADRVNSVAVRRGAPLFDTIPFLSGQSEDGIVGFEEFYDYVHFTPRGARLVGARLLVALQRAGITPPTPGFSVDDYVAQDLERLAVAGGDPLEKSEWLGIGFDPAPRPDRDLWKYDRMLEALDARIAADPGDFRALVYRGNARAFTRDGGADAERDYRAALALDPGNPAILKNLERILAERPTG